jgi:UDP-N-acetylmuramoylalanine--D-glutamate ligase
VPFATLDDLANQRIAIVGLGREGVSTYTFLRNRFPHLPLVLADRTPPDQLSPSVRELIQADPLISLRAGETYLEQISACPSECSVVFRSPGIPPHLPPFEQVREQGGVVLSNTRLFFWLWPGRTVGITGTKGKSTTTALIHAILEHSGQQSRMVGNIGVPPLAALEETETNLSPETIAVAELSSYQLADMEQSPHIAVVLNIVPEHLSYHGSFEAYVAAKANIAHHQSEHDTIIYNADYPLPTQLAQMSRARHIGFGIGSDLRRHSETDYCYGVADEWIVWRGSRQRGDSLHPILPVYDVPLAGRFNLQNVLAAIAVVRELGVDEETIAAAVRTFSPLEHRLEYVGSVGEVAFYNDSLSTVPEAAIAAIESMAPASVVLIAGGYERGLDYHSLARTIRAGQVRALVLFPPSGERIWQAVEALGQGYLPPYVWAEHMDEAVAQAWQAARPGDVVLLSPASASFLRFVDYRDRGHQFKTEVQHLITRLMTHDTHNAHNEGAQDCILC